MPQGFNNNFGEQVMREPISVGWPWKFMITMFIALLVAVLLYLGLAFGYKPFLNNSISTLENNLQVASSTLTLDDKEKFVGFYSQVNNLQNLLREHVLTSKFFASFESFTSKDISYTTLNLSVQDNFVTLEGFAKSYGSLASQISIYKEMPEISNVLLDSSKALGNSVQFRLKLILKDNVLVAK